MTPGVGAEYESNLHVFAIMHMRMNMSHVHPLNSDLGNIPLSKPSPLPQSNFALWHHTHIKNGGGLIRGDRRLTRSVEITNGGAVLGLS